MRLFCYSYCIMMLHHYELHAVGPGHTHHCDATAFISHNCFHIFIKIKIAFGKAVSSGFIIGSTSPTFMKLFYFFMKNTNNASVLAHLSFSVKVIAYKSIKSSNTWSWNRLFCTVHFHARHLNPSSKLHCFIIH